MKTRVVIQQTTYDIYPPGFDLTNAGEVIGFAQGQYLAEIFAEGVVQYNPHAAAQLSSCFHAREQISDIKQQLEDNLLTVVLPADLAKPGEVKSWMKAPSDSRPLDKEAAAKNLNNLQAASASRAGKSLGGVSTSPSRSPSIKSEVLTRKLVVEVAGRDLTRKQMLHINAYQQEYKQRLAADNDHQIPYRSLVTFSHLGPNPRKIGLAITMSGPPSPMVLPLIKAATPCLRTANKAEWDHLLIPIKPLRYCSELRDKHDAEILRDGWMYIFWKGQLWRELEVKSNSAMRDVRVSWYRSQYRFGLHPADAERTAEGHWLNSVWVPYKLENEYQLGRKGVRVVFSASQWTWDVIESLEANTDLLIQKTTSVDAISHYSSQQAFGVEQGDIDSLESSVVRMKGRDSQGMESEKKIASVYLSPVKVLQTLHVSLHDEQGVPVSNARFDVIGARGTVAQGILDEQGEAEMSVQSLDSLRITFPDFDQDLWSPAI
ncbi:hypothetical protein [Alkalimarinus sediminis]|uniref:Uncharacterized protein n=1 Tax=Alkalimarinus sediminis TaxID=1632866 RepID=A0A9E8KQN0_9ALTE|nr:hypothetical protein [Alkalimarinus sediminis]UZW74962.1 hypothetical protein NNL22_18375 [Alkalimarinus sediminis]